VLRLPLLRQRVGWGQWQRDVAVHIPLISHSKAAGGPGYINSRLPLRLVLPSVFPGLPEVGTLIFIELRL